MKKKIRLADRAAHINTLGPGDRYVIWVKGCHRHCRACTSPEFRSFEGGTEYNTSVLATIIAYSGCDGLTISGGEPFEQAEALAEMLSELTKTSDMNIIIYTGYTLEELHAKDDPDIESLLMLTDLLIDGEYIEELDDGGSWRGSSNQRVIPLSNKLTDAVKLYGTPGRTLQVFEIGDTIKSAGIPDYHHNK